jgi:8-oxo-dGTP pyrophosphatase MutT (NUDIX family)
MIPPSVIRARLRPVLEQAPRIRPAPDARPAAVLIPILASTPDPRLVFTRRSDSLSRHAGEISFPGGLVDPGEGLAVAALREAEEELGLAPDDVELLGALEPVHTRVTGVLIVPFVGLLWRDPRFTPNAAEIAEVLEYPLADLAARAEIREFEHEGRWFQTNVFDMDGNVIWGATGHILQTFLDVLRAATKAKEA